MTSQTFTTSSATPPTRGVVPDKPALEGLEVKWGKIWEDEQLYAFDATTVAVSYTHLTLPTNREV